MKKFENEKSNNSSFVILIFEILKFRNIHLVVTNIDPHLNELGKNYNCLRVNSIKFI